MSSNVYKVKYIINGKIDTIYVFSQGPNVFSEHESNEIKANNINVVYSKQQIHFDDTIGVIKIKILEEIKKDVSIEELYLFCNKLEQLNAVSVYQSLTQNKRLELTNIRFQQFIANIVSDENGATFVPPVKKDVYDYDDILGMKIDGKKYIIDKVLGQKFFIIENEYPFITDPYKATDFDSFFERKARKTLSTLNSHLLLSSGTIVDNTIYLCLANDVLTFAEETDLSQESFMKTYFPFLYDKNINNLEDLNNKRTELIEANKQFFNERTLTSFKTVDMFYDVFNTRKTELNYTSRGIKYIKAVLSQDFVVKIPLDVIFKIIHANKTNPLIKYNPSPRQENIYRLYADKVAADGTKILYLKKPSIVQLMSNIAKTKSVAVYIELPLENKRSQTLICEFDENGAVTISCNFVNAVQLADVETTFKNAINPILEEIKGLLEQSGYKLKIFTSLTDDNVEIKQLTFEDQIKISKPLNLESYMGCISNIFINESSGKNVYNLRFKRVSNFNKVTSQEAFILEKIDDGYKGDELVTALLGNYGDDLTRDQALQLVRKVANEVQLEQGAKRTNVKIKDNPGFKTTIVLDPQTGIIKIIVENINDIHYLSTIPIFLDSMVRFTQDVNSTGFPSQEIKRLCSLDRVVDVVIEDIISPVEGSKESLGEKEKEDDVEYLDEGDKLEKAKNAFDLIFGDDDYEEDEEYMVGGVNTLEEDEQQVEDQEGEDPGLEVDDQEGEDQEGEVQEAEDPDLEGEDQEGEDQEGEDQEGEVQEAEDLEVEDQEAEDLEVEDQEAEYQEGEDQEDKELEEDGQEAEDQEDNQVINMDNKQLNKPYYFQERIEQRDPQLILKRRTKHFNSYSRICSSDLKKQPVILTAAELKKIKREHKGFLRPEDVITYGSDPNNKYNYICPRYWCLKTNTIINPSELKEVEVIDEKTGKPVIDKKTGEKVLELEHPTCGRVLPPKADKIIPGHYIYEFYKSTPGKNGKPDTKKYPGLIPNSHPDGFCLPCCFKNYNTVGRKRENEMCLGDKKGSVKPDVQVRQDEYIIGPEKHPLPNGRWGYMPLSIQQMLMVVSADCQISKTNTNIKPNHPCLLRRGVEVNDKQSFIACVANTCFSTKKTADKKPAPIPTITEMKQRILASITIDTFVKFQNGNLVADFHDMNTEVDIEKYKNTKLYSKLDLSKPTDRYFAKKVVSAYENFNDYILDDDALIDHTYLWDIVSTPNASIFPIGVNLVIFKLPNEDITNNVELICPTNHYSSEFYDARKPTIILIEHDGYYEPVYTYTDKGNNRSAISCLFKEYDPTLSANMRAVFKDIVKPFFHNVCRPLESMPPGGLSEPSVYEAKHAITLYNLIQKLDKYKYQLVKLVINFNSKVIGVVANSPTNQTGFVPCYPSSINDELKENIDYVLMTDFDLWKTYDETYTFLDQLSRRSAKKRENPDIPCKPAFKVIEDGLVVGILTETNQFIQLSEPVAELDIRPDKNIPSLDNNSYIVNVKDRPMISADIPITASDDVDKERVDYIKKIKLETNFFNVFRNTIRILLNDYDNVAMREKIEAELTRAYVIYTKKMTNMVKLLQDLVDNKIQFTGDENYYKAIDEVTTCIIKNNDNCSSKVCAITNGSCNLILPEKNLMTRKLNKQIYFERMADELIRYNRITAFMLQPQNYLSFGNIGYNLNNDEIIMIQSLLKEYFELNLVPSITNQYVKYTSYDEAEPALTQVYENKEQEGAPQICLQKTGDSITSGRWNAVFPDTYKEVTYGKTKICTFTTVINLIEKNTNEKITINQLKNVLYDEYRKYLEEYQQKIVDILITEGKKTLGDQVKSGSLSFGSFIYTDNYFLTPFDIWLLVQKYTIPTILISQRELMQTNYKEFAFIGYGERDDKFAFIVVPGLDPEKIPGYKLVVNDKNETFISLDKIEDPSMIDKAFETRMSIKEYLIQFTKKALALNVKKKKLVRV